MMKNEVYIVTGTTESVEQTRIGGNFEKSYSKECVAAFNTREAAEEFVKSHKLKKPVHFSFSGTRYFRGGFYEMEVETVAFHDCNHEETF
jgi:hypothetical protein